MRCCAGASDGCAASACSAERAGGVGAQARRFESQLAELRASRGRHPHRRRQRPALRAAAGVLRARASGRACKYRCALLARAGDETLDAAEEAMLDAAPASAPASSDGQDVLELGCGWGSLTLWMAERYPRARIIAVSNSRPQRDFIAASSARARPRQRRAWSPRT